MWWARTSSDTLAPEWHQKTRNTTAMVPQGTSVSALSAPFILSYDGSHSHPFCLEKVRHQGRGIGPAGWNAHTRPRPGCIQVLYKRLRSKPNDKWMIACLNAGGLSAEKTLNLFGRCLYCPRHQQLKFFQKMQFRHCFLNIYVSVRGHSHMWQWETYF